MNNNISLEGTLFALKFLYIKKEKQVVKVQTLELFRNSELEISTWSYFHISKEVMWYIHLLTYIRKKCITNLKIYMCGTNITETEPCNLNNWTYDISLTKWWIEIWWNETKPAHLGSKLAWCFNFNLWLLVTFLSLGPCDSDLKKDNNVSWRWCLRSLTCDFSSSSIYSVSFSKLFLKNCNYFNFFC